MSSALVRRGMIQKGPDYINELGLVILAPDPDTTAQYKAELEKQIEDYKRNLDAFTEAARAFVMKM